MPPLRIVDSITELGAGDEGCLAACTVSHESARIGEAQSTINHGMVNHLYGLALTLNVQVGQPCLQLIEHLQTQPRRLS